MTSLQHNQNAFVTRCPSCRDSTNGVCSDNMSNRVSGLVLMCEICIEEAPPTVDILNPGMLSACCGIYFHQSCFTHYNTACARRIARSSVLVAPSWRDAVWNRWNTIRDLWDSDRGLPDSLLEVKRVDSEIYSDLLEARRIYICTIRAQFDIDRAQWYADRRRLRTERGQLYIELSRTNS